MFLDSPTDRPVPSRESIRQAFAELVDQFEGAVPGPVILTALMDAATRLSLRIKGVDLTDSRRRGARP